MTASLEANVSNDGRACRPDVPATRLQPSAPAARQTGTVRRCATAIETYTLITINADSHPLMRWMHKPDPMLRPDDQDKRMVAVLDDDMQDAWLRAAPTEAEQLVRR